MRVFGGLWEYEMEIRVKGDYDGGVPIMDYKKRRRRRQRGGGRKGRGGEREGSLTQLNVFLLS